MSVMLNYCEIPWKFSSKVCAAAMTKIVKTAAYEKKRRRKTAPR